MRISVSSMQLAVIWIITVFYRLLDNNGNIKGSTGYSTHSRLYSKEWGIYTDIKVIFLYLALFYGYYCGFRKETVFSVYSGIIPIFPIFPNNNGI